MKGRKGIDRRGRRALAAARPLAREGPAGHGRHADRRRPIDLLPTLADLAGVDARRRQAARRHQPRAVAARQGRDDGRTACCSSTGPARSAPATSATGSTPPGSSSTWSPTPGRQKDVAAEHREVAKRLAEAVDRWRRDVLGELPKTDDRPFPVGYAEFPRTRAAGPRRRPARRREAQRGAPNCSFFTNWTKPDDRMTWDVEVHDGGQVRGDRPLHLPEGGRRLGRSS